MHFHFPDRRNPSSNRGREKTGTPVNWQLKSHGDETKPILPSGKYRIENSNEEKKEREGIGKRKIEIRKKKSSRAERERERERERDKIAVDAIVATFASATQTIFLSARSRKLGGQFPRLYLSWRSSNFDNDADNVIIKLRWPRTGANACSNELSCIIARIPFTSRSPVTSLSNYLTGASRIVNCGGINRIGESHLSPFHDKKSIEERFVYPKTDRSRIQKDRAIVPRVR